MESPQRWENSLGMMDSTLLKGQSQARASQVTTEMAIISPASPSIPTQTSFTWGNTGGSLFSCLLGSRLVWRWNAEAQELACLGLQPGSITPERYHLGQVSWPLWASVTSSVEDSVMGRYYYLPCRTVMRIKHTASCKAVRAGLGL